MGSNPSGHLPARRSSYRRIRDRRGGATAWNSPGSCPTLIGVVGDHDEMAQICWRTDARNCTRPCHSNRATPGQRPARGSGPSAQDNRQGNRQISMVVSRTAKGTESDALALHSAAGPGSPGDNRTARVLDGRAARSGRLSAAPTPPIRTLLRRPAPRRWSGPYTKTGWSLRPERRWPAGVWAFRRRLSAAVHRRRSGSILVVSVVPRRRKAAHRCA